MMGRDTKAAFYLFFGPLMAFNARLYRHLRAPRQGTVRVHLGPGQQKYLDGWINVDANTFTAKCDVWADLRRRLPFIDGTVDAFYSHHVVEHLPDLDRHFRDVFRCLKPGGVYRVAGPNGDASIEKFLQGDVEWFSIPRWSDRRTSPGGVLDNFLMCRGEHLHVLTFSFLVELMSSAGFEEFSTCFPKKETRYPGIFAECLEQEWETDSVDPHTLIIEARRPVLTGEQASTLAVESSGHSSLVTVP
jgi:predicted SAM-dependent methyltransferase